MFMKSLTPCSLAINRYASRLLLLKKSLAISHDSLPAMLIPRGGRLLVSARLPTVQSQRSQSLINKFAKDVGLDKKPPEAPKGKSNPWIEWPVRIVVYGLAGGLGYFGYNSYTNRKRRLATIEDIPQDKNTLVQGTFFRS